MAQLQRVGSRSATEAPEAIELAICLLEGHHPAEKVEAALVYRGYSEQTARELVQGVLSGRIVNAPTENQERYGKDWASLPAPIVLVLGLVVISITVIGAAIGKVRVISLGFLVFGLLTSCAGLQRLIGPKRRGLSTALCALLIVLATIAVRFLRLRP